MELSSLGLLKKQWDVLFCKRALAEYLKQIGPFLAEYWKQFLVAELQGHCNMTSLGQGQANFM
jgi:hypothetical protein